MTTTTTTDPMIDNRFILIPEDLGLAIYATVELDAYGETAAITNFFIDGLELVRSVYVPRTTVTTETREPLPRSLA